jgi:hypothetical protein
MMKNRNALLARLLAFTLAVAPAMPALADGGRHGGGPIRGLTQVIVGTAVAAITLPLVIAAAVAGAPVYEEEGPGYGPGYEPGYYANPGASYYAPPPPPVYYAPRPAPRYYAPYGAAPYYARPHAYYAPPRPAYYGRRYSYDAPPYGERRYRH